MSLLDVFSGKQSLGSWLTGRDPKESDVYANYDKVATVADSIRSISTTQLTTAQESIYAAFEQLNKVNGLAQYVGSIEVSNYDTVFESISDTIGDIATQLEGKAKDIKTYEESSIFEKVGSTVFMGVCKLGEGLLSVVEDLGDGVVSLVGWGAGAVGATAFQEDCAKFVKSEWSHDAFNFYYESDFAKKSAFTEDSAIAGGLKIVGKTVGYLYAGGMVAGQLGLSGATNVGVGVLKASGSTWGATIAGAVGGFGGGTEAGLNAGMSFNEAAGVGLKTAAIQGGLAFVGGKIGEKLSKSAAVKEASKAADSADDALGAAKKAAESADDVLSKAQQGVTDAQKAATEAAQKLDDLYSAGANDKAILAQEAVRDQADDALLAAKKTLEGATKDAASAHTALDAATKSASDASSALTAAKESSAASYQGYSDSVTKAGERFGEASHDVVVNSAKALKETAEASIAIKKGAADAGMKSAEAAQAQGALKDSLKTLAKENPVTQGAGVVKSAAGSTVDAVKNGATYVKTNGITGTVKNGLSNAKDAATAAVQTVKGEGVIQTVKNAAAGVATHVTPATPGVVATAAGATVNETIQSEGRAVVEAKANLNHSGLVDKTENAEQIAKDSIKNPTGEATPNPNPDPSPDPGGNNNGGNNNGGNNNGGNNNGGNNNNGGYNGYNGYNGNNNNDQQQPQQPEQQQPQQPDQPEQQQPDQPEQQQPQQPQQPEQQQPEQPQQQTPQQPTPSQPSPQQPAQAEPYTQVITASAEEPAHSGVAFDGETTDVDSLELENAEELGLLDDLEESATSLDDVISGSKYTKIPTSDTPLPTNQKSKSSVIPIAAGLSVAAAAGIGAKAYMDHKKNNDNGEYDDEDDEYDDDFDSEEWSGDEDTVAIDYTATSNADSDEDNYLEEDNYYQDDSGYTARSSNELADLQ